MKHVCIVCKLFNNDWNFHFDNSRNYPFPDNEILDLYVHLDDFDLDLYPDRDDLDLDLDVVIYKLIANNK